MAETRWAKSASSSVVVEIHEWTPRVIVVLTMVRLAASRFGFERRWLIFVSTGKRYPLYSKKTSLGKSVGISEALEDARSGSRTPGARDGVAGLQRLRPAVADRQEHLDEVG